jgi:hypothetical protein
LEEGEEPICQMFLLELIKKKEQLRKQTGDKPDDFVDIGKFTLIGLQAKVLQTRLQCKSFFVELNK